MALTKAEGKLLQEARDAALESMTLLKGANGGGLISHVSSHDDEFNNVHTRIDDSDQRHNKLSRNFWALVGILVGSGVIGGSLWKILS